MEPTDSTSSSAGVTPLTLLSWNLALLARSGDAPLSWDQSQSEATVRDVVLTESPDVVFFQELPGLVPYVETHELVQAFTRSHSGALGILLGNDIAEESWTTTVIDGSAVLVTSTARNLTLANVHLAPGSGSQVSRVAQLAAIVEASPTESLVILGDTNTRGAEIALIEQLGLKAPRPPAFTWDSTRNRFHDGPAFQTHFTRAFTRGSVSLANQQVIEGLVRHQDRRFYPSDHFALRVDLETRLTENSGRRVRDLDASVPDSPDAFYRHVDDVAWS